MNTPFQGLISFVNAVSQGFTLGCINPPLRGFAYMRIKMMKENNTSLRFAVCIQNDEYPASLERHKIYRVLPDEEAESDGDIRLIDESGEDYLYPAEWFVAIAVPHEVEISLLHVSKIR
jgi:hypothetical protein